MDYTLVMEKGSRKILLPVIIEQDEDGYYTGSVPTLRSCYTQGETLAELYENLKEVVPLCLEVTEEFFAGEPYRNHVVKMQQIEFTY